MAGTTGNIFSWGHISSHNDGLTERNYLYTTLPASAYFQEMCYIVVVLQQKTNIKGFYNASESI